MHSEFPEDVLPKHQSPCEVRRTADYSRHAQLAQWSIIEEGKPSAQSIQALLDRGCQSPGAYGIRDDEKWHKAMQEASEKYTKLRLSGKRTKREAERWPKDGYASIRKVAKQLHEEVAHLENRKPSTLSAWERYLYQRWVILLFYSHHAMRGDLADVQLTKGARSWIRHKGKKWTLHVGHHKTMKSRGAIEFKVDDPVSAAFSKFVPMVKAAKLKHKYLLSTSRGKQLQRQDMLKLISATTERYLGKKIGVQILRVLKTTSKIKDLDTATELQHEMTFRPNSATIYLAGVEAELGYPVLLELCRQPPGSVIKFRVGVVVAPNALPPVLTHVVDRDLVLELRGVPGRHHKFFYHAVNPVALGPVRPSVTITVLEESLLKLPDSSANVKVGGGFSRRT